MEKAAVGQATRRDYGRRVARFTAWAAWAGMALTSVTHADTATTRYMNEPFFDGRSHSVLRRDSSKGAPELTRALRAAQGWRRLSPARARKPLPWLLTVVIASAMAFQGALQEARATVMTFVHYLRPSEALRVSRGCLIPPVAASGLHAAARRPAWSVILHPFEEGTPSKTREFDETLLVDNPEFGFMADVLALMRGGALYEPALETTYSKWTAAFARAVATLGGLTRFGPPVLYQLRHGGASHELYTQLRDLLGVQKRGRWTGSRSLRRYEKGARLSQLLSLLTPAQLDHARACEARLGDVLCGRLRPIPPSW